jgi:ferric-dicitrate binding protein FerR (iron transport regulator)
MKNDTLAHLRRLNPVPEAAPVDGAELFDRITSLPQHEPLRARRPQYRRRVALVAVGLAVMALLATTALAISGWFGDVVKPPVTRQEYKNAQDVLTLPPGATWPDLNVDPNSVTSRGGGGAMAVMIAMGSWECYWADAIRSGDQQAQQQAHAELDSLLADHAVIAPAGASENWAPTGHPFPVAAFADDGGY